MSSDQSASRPGASSSSAQPLGDESPPSHVQPPDQYDPQTYSTLSYAAKGKARASDEDLAASLDQATQHVQHALDQLTISATQQTSQSAEPTRRHTRKGRDATSRSSAPSPLRSPPTTSPTTGDASQFVSLLGQPVAVSASLSASDKPSTTTASAALPSLYKASRGRSANVSPSRRWDRRGASASVLSGASASGSGGEADDASEEESVIPQSHRRVARPLHRSSPLRNSQAINGKSSRHLSIAKEEALFPSDEDDSPLLSSTEDLDTTHANRNAHRRRSRRWSSIERERRRGMRILLQQRPSDAQDSTSPPTSRLKSSSRGRTRQSSHLNRTSDDDVSDLESSSPSSSASSCEISYVHSASDTPAIDIKERSSRSTGQCEGVANASTDGASSHDNPPSSTDGSDRPSPAVSTPSTSLVQRSPPGFTALKPLVPIPVTSESDPLGHIVHSIEDMIQVDKVEFFPEETIAAQHSASQTKRRTSPKHVKKSSWIIGDFESEPEDDEEQAPGSPPQNASPVRGQSLVRAHAAGTSPPSPSASSYQARLAGLQSQLRIWSRAPDEAAAPRVRQTSSGFEDMTEAEPEPSLLSASWRNLARLPNLILLPGLAARQARESLASAAKVSGDALASPSNDRHLTAAAENDFAQIYRLASAASASDEQGLQTQRKVALKTGRPPSPSPSPSPPASLHGSRQSSNDSICTTDKGSHTHKLDSASRRGRGVASLPEADRDPSAYVSGLGQPIDPDTELSSVVQLQTFRSRSRSRPAAGVGGRGRATDRPHKDAQHPGADGDKQAGATGATSPRKLGQPIELQPAEEGRATNQASRPHKAERPLRSVRASPGEGLTVDVGGASAKGYDRNGLDRQDPFSHGPAPTDTASAPTSPTFRKGSSSSASSADEADVTPPRSRAADKAGDMAIDSDGFRVVRRRHRRTSSGPRSLRPKVDAPVPHGFSAFDIKEDDENAEGSDSDGDVTPSPSRTRSGRGRRGRDTSPRRSSRQCAVGLFGGGVSAADSASSRGSSSRPRRNSRRDGSLISVSTPIRSVRSSPDLTYAAAAATARANGAEAESEQGAGDDPSPPRGSRGRRGAVKVVASSIGQQGASMAQPLLIGGLDGLRRGPSYPPRADEILDETASGIDGSDDESAASQHSAPSGRGRSASSPGCGGGAAQGLRFRLLSNSSHLLMLSLELDMIKKQKISAPLKPRWGKHRADDFNPLPSTIACTSSAALFASSQYLRAPFSATEGTNCADEECGGSTCGAPERIAVPGRSSRTSLAAIHTLGGGLRDPSSRLRFSWSLADIAAALEAAPSDH
ncbi:uncharacterized protein PAN0_001c0016 [Moesziomyces antarcticus]|uniref:Uncharacterized protein n=1 Tax=Pseudozyma antarctica TaxID=84753 RepID=A0A5C3FD99_PSEA2|nr:uncharacterized protein PAN0_001c0016 [Moesziomyces antarcticus]GAK61821.1 conserved hypothetical protein [Moesziomyces antarcticus]SPO42338.1 uncharacterized protein PSANT_00021 [Moesziomyces antarcticus]